tara:strand:- start:248 stop:394 length:147 start_codon:yes stop_codon:yes gene_type:complete
MRLFAQKVFSQRSKYNFLNPLHLIVLQTFRYRLNATQKKLLNACIFTD